MFILCDDDSDDIILFFLNFTYILTLTQIANYLYIIFYWRNNVYK